MKIKLPRNILTLLIKMIEHAVTETDSCRAAEKMVLAILFELSKSFQRRLVDVKKAYSVKLKTAEALALYILLSPVKKDYTTAEGNALQIIVNAIHQQFNLC